MKKIILFLLCCFIFSSFYLPVSSEVLGVLVDPAENLKTVCNKVINFDSELLNKVNNVKETLESLHGAGLAANQVGYNERFFVIFISSKVDVKEGEIEYLSGMPGPEKDKSLVFINPTILEETGEQEVLEMCFSLPDIVYKLKRPKTVLVEAFDVTGEKFTVKATGFWAKCICHEYDHLNGILCSDKALEYWKL